MVKKSYKQLYDIGLQIINNKNLDIAIISDLLDRTIHYYAFCGISQKYQVNFKFHWWMNSKNTPKFIEIQGRYRYLTFEWNKEGIIEQISYTE